MAALAFDEAVRNALATGAKFGYLACLDNFSWPDPIRSEKTPDGEHKLGALVRSCIALYDCATGYGIPIISGKDSMKNDYYSGDKKYSIPPTLLVSVIGKIDDIRKALSSEFRVAGSEIYVLGSTREEMGGSEFYCLFGSIGNTPPQLKTEETIPLYRALSSATEEGLLLSAHDVSDGGLAVALAECCLGTKIGAEIDLDLVPRETEMEEALLFSESAGRFVVSVSSEKTTRFETILKENGALHFAKCGRVRGDKRMIIRRADLAIINESVDSLRDAYDKGVI
jgi:phosphoribosylformylglycinamidine synthase